MFAPFLRIAFFFCMDIKYVVGKRQFWSSGVQNEMREDCGVVSEMSSLHSCCKMFPDIKKEGNGFSDFRQRGCFSSSPSFKNGSYCSIEQHG